MRGNGLLQSSNGNEETRRVDGGVRRASRNRGERVQGPLSNRERSHSHTRDSRQEGHSELDRISHSGRHKWSPTDIGG